MNLPRTYTLVNVAFGAIVAAMVTALGIAISTLPTEATGLTDPVASQLDQSGVQNPVTAVLLNFRGYDTMLELAVLLMAVLGARALSNAASKPPPERSDWQKSPVLPAFVYVMAPLMIVVAGYLLWVGGHEPGGAFQAGAVLAALGVLLWLADVNWAGRLSASAERWLLISGLAIFLVIGLGTMSPQRHLLEFSPYSAKWLILLIEAVATLSIAAILLALYGSGTLQQAHPEPETAAERNDP